MSLFRKLTIFGVWFNLVTEILIVATNIWLCYDSHLHAVGENTNFDSLEASLNCVSSNWKPIIFYTILLAFIVLAIIGVHLTAEDGELAPKALQLKRKTWLIVPYIVIGSLTSLLILFSWFVVFISLVTFGETRASIFYFIYMIWEAVVVGFLIVLCKYYSNTKESTSRTINGDLSSYKELMSRENEA